MSAKVLLLSQPEFFFQEKQIITEEFFTQVGPRLSGAQACV